MSLFGSIMMYFNARSVEKQLARISKNLAAKRETARFFADRLSLYRTRCSEYGGQPQIETLIAINSDAQSLRHSNLRGFQDPAWSAAFVAEGWAVAKIASLKGRCWPSIADNLERKLIAWTKATIGDHEFEDFMRKDWSDD